MRRLLLLSALPLLAAAPAAEAATVAYDESPRKLRIDAGAGEVNRITVTQSGTTYTIRDQTTSPTVDLGTTQCSPGAPGEVVCALPVEDAKVHVDAGDLDDQVTVTTARGAVIKGRDGADVLTGGDADDDLSGGPGVDAFVAGAGDDTVDAQDELAEDVDCGAGTDGGVADVADRLAGCETVSTTLPPADPQGGKGPHKGGVTPPRGAPVAPVAGKSVGVAVKQGTILVQSPGATQAVPLDPTQPVPVGSVLDARNGTLTLTAANGIGAAASQAADFTGSKFVVAQKPGVVGTELRMTGGDFSACAAATTASRTATARAAARRKRIRRLWGSGHGRFTTRGRNSAATVRGTIWTVEDRCDGTLTRVTRGVVVVHDFARKRTKVVRAGQSYLAKRRR